MHFSRGLQRIFQLELLINGLPESAMSSTRLTQEELAAIADRHARTTTGEWRFAEGGVNGQPFLSTDAEDSASGYGVLFNVEWASDADVVFVARAHQDVPRLLADLSNVLTANAQHRAQALALADDIEALRAAAGRRDAEIADLRSTILEREAQVASLAAEHESRVLTMAGEIEALRAAVAERDALAARTSDEHDRQMLDLLNAVEELRANAVRQQAKIHERDGLIRELLFRYQPIFLCDVCGQHGAPQLYHAPDCLIARATNLVGRSSRMRMIASSPEQRAAPDGPVAIAAPVDEGLDIGEALP